MLIVNCIIPLQIETLYNDLETNFYTKPEKVAPLLKRSGVHDLSAMLKRWLRELPQPLLSNELVHLFYQTHGELNGILLTLIAILIRLVSPRSYSPTGPIQSTFCAVFVVAARKQGHF